MQAAINRKQLQLKGDPTRVIGRFFWAGEARAAELIHRVLKMSDHETHQALMRTLRGFAGRHRNLNQVFLRHLNAALDRVPAERAAVERTSDEKKSLIGAFFTHEYSIESAAFFNPSLVPALDQTDLQEGEIRLVMSVRAVGEGHISSIVFRNIILNAQNEPRSEKPSAFVGLAETIHYANYDKKDFARRIQEEAHLDPSLLSRLIDPLPANFNHRELFEQYWALYGSYPEDSTEREDLSHLMTVADRYYEVHFSLDTDLSERVLHPMIDFEMKGIEDARFLQFRRDDGSKVYYGTYTAYNGQQIRPMLIETPDFYEFTIRPIYGDAAINKNHALFPRKINGHYYVLCRVDGINNYIVRTNRLQVWDDAILLSQPQFTWQLYQIGNCGPPIETKHGWVVITHGVGPMRKYCLGAMLLDLDDPTIVLGRLPEPLLSPREDEREGYVPNVVYSCGSILHNDEIFIPYGISDEAIRFATIALPDLIARMVAPDNMAKQDMYVSAENDSKGNDQEGALTQVQGKGTKRKELPTPLP
ncbi:glycoside hydrolase family 130 protein [Neolewinella lacunae]|uniref:Glycoside hydrolase family 130 protein n=1 Tax=Neolewinella lacunae TaxID=1517758 RepID=A0A923T9B1_9BACT|nr:glycoside hydrolase family 130 protein [Neolewinella lacunae]MBC6994873.1 glycoside hydrolase family 130 protein [Neolewinella lacunae]MDN3636793.1 glycoside hydrolase family 130 protein [Neolewinella lacunae]